MRNHLTRTIFLLVLFSSAIQGFSQTIHGIVADKITTRAIPYANIYFNGTYTGTTSNEEGEFYLSLKENNPRPITATSIGYFSMTLDDYPIDSLVYIYLYPKVYDIAAVIIKPDNMSRSKKERIFRNEFLGTDHNASRCTILNMEDIVLVHNESTNSLNAFCDKPIIIENNALKYRINYFLDQFDCSKDSVFISGTYYFSEIPYSHTKTIAERRKDTYLGSRMHFIRSLYDNRLQTEGFTMRIVENQLQTEVYSMMLVDSLKLGYSDIVVDSTAQEKFLSQDNYILVKYPEKFQRTLLIFTKKRVAIDKSGYFDPRGLKWSGYMASQRIADLLPFEYKINE